MSQFFISPLNNNTTDNWAKPISDYLLLRQAQQSNHQLANGQGNQHRLLFQAFMGILVNQLQEGHTCFELTDSKEMSDMSWQNQLIYAVAMPLTDFILTQWQIAINIYGRIQNDVQSDVQNNDVQAISQHVVSQRVWLSILIADFKKNGEKNGMKNGLGIDRTKEHGKKINRADAEAQLLSLVNQMINQILTQFMPINTDDSHHDHNSWSNHHKNGIYQQLAMQLQQVADDTILQVYEQLMLTQQLIRWLNQYDEHADLTQFTQRFDQGSAYFISANDLIGNTDTDTDTDINANANANATFKKNGKKVHAKPLVYDVNNTSIFTCWLHRSWQAEHDIARHILRISTQSISRLNMVLDMDSIIDKLKLDIQPQQRDAIQIANRSAFSIITGGPGTGKTYTVAALVLALHHHSQYQSSHSSKSLKKSLTLALAAPTGKAAQRMQESLQHSIEKSGTQMLLPKAKTVHRLLGIGMDGIVKYHENNPLSEDIIIIDEASMLGAELTSQLLAAVKTGSRLILLGDAKQLAAVEAGSVLADLCAIKHIAPMQVTLTQSRRFDDKSAVGQLATMIYQGDAKPSSDASHDKSPITQLAELLTRFGTLQHVPFTNNSTNRAGMAFIKQHYLPYVTHCLQTLETLGKKSTQIDVGKLFSQFNHFRILTAGHHGMWGDDGINEWLTLWHKEKIKSAISAIKSQQASASQTNARHIRLPANHAIWYHGRPIMIQKNTYTLGLYNGDVGICLYHADRGYEVYFEGRELPLSVNMLDEAILSTAYAITVHKSQGSEFEHVALVFDPSSQRLLSRELIYTGVTRAKTAVSLLMSDDDFIKAVQTPTVRQTGLAWHFDHINHTSSP